MIAEYEWIAEYGTYREWMIPAELVNRYGPPRVVDEFEIDEDEDIPNRFRDGAPNDA